MGAVNHQPQVFHFGAFELDPQSGELRKHGIKLKLQHQPLQILAILLERPGEVVAREKIQKRLWPGNTYVDFDNAINSAVRKLRDALGDTAENPRFIETLSRRGYRFIYPITGGVRVSPLGLPKVAGKHHRGHWFALAVSAAVAVGGITFWIANSRNEVASPPAPPVPLTSYPGFEQFPSFSPDGSRVAFSWDQPGKRPSNIFVKLIGPGDPVRLTTNSGDFAPTWSPDGRFIAFLRKRDSDYASVMVMPALGGQERELASIAFDTTWYVWHGALRWGVPPPLLAWSADSRWLLALEQDAPILGTHHVIRISAETGEKRRLTFPPRSISDGDGSLAVSPDGEMLAFTRTIAGFVGDVFILPLSSDFLPKGDPQRLTFDNKEIAGLAWTADGRSLVFPSSRSGKLELWRIAPKPSSNPIRLTAAGDDPVDIAISRQGRRLVYRHALDDVNIWRVSLKGKQAGESASFISSTRWEAHARCSPDGKRIAFESNRSGNEEIWTCNGDGTNPVQLTSFGNAWAGSPRWSPDGQKIAFDCSAAGTWDIYVINSRGGRPTRLTTNPASEVRPSWSRDGKWVYYSSNRTGISQIWKMAASGGPEIQVTKNLGYVAFESVDGQTLYYSNGRDLWRMPVRGGDETRFLESTGTRFALAKDGVYFVDSRDQHLKFFNFQTRAIKHIAALPGRIGSEISVTPDEQWMMYDKQDGTGSELMLVENFR